MPDGGTRITLVEVQCICAKPQRIETAAGTICGRCWMFVAPSKRVIVRG